VLTAPWRPPQHKKVSLDPKQTVPTTTANPLVCGRRLRLWILQVDAFPFL